MPEEIIHFVATLEEPASPVLCGCDATPGYLHLVVETDPTAVTCEACRALLGDARLLDGMPAHRPTVEFIRVVAGWTAQAREAAYDDMGLSPAGREISTAVHRLPPAPALLDAAVPTLGTPVSAQTEIEDLHARIRAAVKGKPQ